MKISRVAKKKAIVLDRKISKYPDNDRGNLKLIENMSTFMPYFKELMDLSSTQELDMLCTILPNLNRFARIIETIAHGFADESISLPS